MPIFMEILRDGKEDIQGTVKWPKQDKNKRYINVDSCETDVEREILEGTAAAKNREWKSPTVNAITMNLKVDNSTGPLSAWAVAGGSRDVNVYFVKSGGQDSYVIYMTWKLKQAILSHFGMNADDSPEERGTTELGFSFLTLEIQTIEYNEDGAKGRETKRIIDLSEATGA